MTLILDWPSRITHNRYGTQGSSHTQAPLLVFYISNILVDKITLCKGCNFHRDAFYIQSLQVIWTVPHIMTSDSVGHHGRLNLKDPLQIPNGPITKSRAKKIKETMQGLVQSTWAEFANLSSKTPTFKMGLKEEELALIHVIQAIDGGSIA
jgi:hypothetical protein